MKTQTGGPVVEIPLPAAAVALRPGDAVTVRPVPDPAFHRC
jgi:hypothetical protein